jgi:hypothetical protein
MLKATVSILALLVIANTFSVKTSDTADDKVLVELYSESLCPYCR